MNYSIVPSKERQIEAILKEFNFGRVNKAMTALNWTWAKPNGTPSVEQMREWVRGLFAALDEDPETLSCSSGGFVASRGEDGALSLEFYIDRSYGPDAVEWVEYQDAMAAIKDAHR